MNTQKAQRIILVAAGLVLLIGTVNSVGKNKTWPSSKFWLGTGFMVVALSALAEVEPEIAAPLSLAVLTTVILGEGDGLLSYIAVRGEANTQRPQKKDSTVTTGAPAGTPQTVPIRTNLAGTKILFA